MQRCIYGVFYPLFIISVIMTDKISCKLVLRYARYLVHSFTKIIFANIVMLHFVCVRVCVYVCHIFLSNVENENGRILQRYTYRLFYPLFIICITMNDKIFSKLVLRYTKYLVHSFTKIPSSLSSLIFERLVKIKTREINFTKKKKKILFIVYPILPTTNYLVNSSSQKWILQKYNVFSFSNTSDLARCPR